MKPQKTVMNSRTDQAEAAWQESQLDQRLAMGLVTDLLGNCRSIRRAAGRQDGFCMFFA